MSAGSLNQLSPVQQVLNNCRRQIRRHTVLAGMSSVAIVVATYLLAAGLLDYLIGLPAVVRAGVLVTFVVAVLAVAWKSLLRPLLTSIPDEQLGAAVDLSAPDLQESVATLLSIERDNVTSSEAGSEVMRRYLKQQLVGRLKTVSTTDVIDYHRTRRRLGLAGLLILAAVLPVLARPSLAQLLMHRMVSPFDNLASASNLYFDIPDGDRTVARGSTVVISATPKWRSGSPGSRPDNVDLTLIAASGDTDTLPMLFDEVAGHYVIDLARISETLQYQVSGGGATSQVHTITVVTAPEIRAAVMTATPPMYAGQAVRKFDGMIGSMEVFERSQLDVRLEFNKPVTRATLVWADRDARPVTVSEMLEIEFDDLSGEEVFDIDPDAPLMAKTEPLVSRIDATLAADGMAATLTLSADVGGDFVFEVLDEHELSNSVEPDRHLTVIYDLPPELHVSGLRDSDRFRPDDILPVNCLAVDDIGVGTLELYYKVNDDVEQILPAADFDAGSLEVQHAFRLPLDQLQLTSGDRLTVRVRATDERPEPGPQETWWKPFTIHIDKDAEAAGQKALSEETQQMVDALKQLEELLRQDAGKADELKDKARQQWDDEARDQTQRLSEKEQQQGQILHRLADDVASHPMMQKSAEKLQQLSETLRTDLPEQLQQAVDQERLQAANSLDEAKSVLNDAARTLHEEIQNIEEIAKLEQDLAELNRLALNAEQLAKNAAQLEQDRRDEQKQNKPEELSDAEWQQQLDDKQQDLMLEEQQLSGQLNDLLKEQQELLHAAQEAQREQLKSLSDVAKQLAKQQDAVADGVQGEARQAAQDAREITQKLEQAKRDAEQLNTDLADLKDVAELKDVAPTDVSRLDKAAQDLQQGDLAGPKAMVDDVAKAVQQTEQQIKAVDAASEPQSVAAADQANQLAKQLQDIGADIANLQQKRLPPQAQQPPQTPAPEVDANTDAVPPSTPPENPVKSMLDHLGQLAQTARDVADGVQSDATSAPQTQQAAQQAAEKSEEASQQAQAGQFADAAQDLREAAESVQNAGQQMNTPEQQDRRQQTERLQNDLRRMADTLQNLQQDSASQLAAQQNAQQRIADQADDLPGQLQELSERLNMDALQMAPQAQQSRLAQQAAQDAQQTSQQASTELQQQDLNKAGSNGKATAEQLNRLAELAQQAGQSPDGEPSPVPTEVGENVADALQDLAQAAQAMQQAQQSQQVADGNSPPGDSGQSAEQPGQGQQGQGQPGQGEEVASAEPGQPGDGEPGAGESSESGGPSGDQPGKQGEGDGSPGQNAGSQQLSAAAKALAQAAKQALPGQFNPGQMAENAESSGEGRDAMGNAAMWNGLLPNAAAGPAASRNWGRANDQLETETTDSGNVSRDREYEALIRMYFREVAKAASQK
ncbi:MAG: hypothetical protein R3C59_30660 [Planctomycetaceae bacterium]